MGLLKKETVKTPQSQSRIIFAFLPDWMLL